MLRRCVQTSNRNLRLTAAVAGNAIDALSDAYRARDALDPLAILVQAPEGRWLIVQHHSSPIPRKSRNANESATRQAMPRSASMPSK